MTVRAFVVVFLVVFATAAWAADAVYGVEIVPWSKKLDEGRYQSSRDYEQTKKFFHDQFKGWKHIKWHAEVSLPTVKYVHIENTFEKRKWDGINVYLLPDGHVRYYVLAHVSTTTTPAPKAPAPAK